MEILGHSQIGITMDVYTHVVQDTQREAMSSSGTGGGAPVASDQRRPPPLMSKVDVKGPGP